MNPNPKERIEFCNTYSCGQTNFKKNNIQIGGSRAANSCYSVTL